MKRIISSIVATVFIAGLFLLAGCGSKGSTDFSQVFERMIAGDQIAQYIPYGADGLISEYEYVEHIYHQGESKAYLSIFRTAYTFDTEEHAQKRFTTLQRSYKDDVVIQGRAVYVNQEFNNSNVGTITGGQRTYDEMFDYMADQGYTLIEKKDPTGTNPNTAS